MTVNTILYFIEELFRILSQIGWLFVLVLGYLFARWQFKFQSAHERRLEVIEEAYSKLKLVSISFRSLTSPLQEAIDFDEEEKKKEKDLVEKVNDTLVYLDTKRFFFSNEEQKNIDAITNKFFQTWNNYRYKKILKMIVL